MELKAPYRTWAEVDLDRIVHNYNEFKRITTFDGKRPAIMCIVKANAYGHGAVTVSKRLAQENCDMLGVAAFEEALELRRAGIAVPILVLNHIDASCIDEALENDITMTVFSKDMARLISEKATGRVKVHVKIDTGLNRVGLKPGEVFEAIKYIHSLANIEIEGVFTHFASAASRDGSFTEQQTAHMLKIFEDMQSAGIDIRFKHAANSAAAIMYPYTLFNMVRIGVSLYGCYTSEEVDKSKIDLKPAMQLKTQIIRIVDLEPNEPVSYGGLFVTTRPTRLATIPLGYGDGISAVLTGKLKVLINGQLAPVVGKICMDLCMVDITDVTGEVALNDEVVVYGEQKGAAISVEQVADLAGTVNDEILCITSMRVPRYYIEGGRIVGKVDFILGV